MSTQSDPHLEARVGLLLKGTYRLERLLGAGAWGAVYAASDGRTHFAVKLVHPHVLFNAEAIQRFFREARACAQINDVHIVPVVDTGTHAEESGEAIPYLVMPMLNGRDLADLLHGVGPLRPDVAVQLVLQACEGLAAAHEIGVIHRDIKPSNLFVHLRANDEVQLYVCDFGIAKRRELYDDASLTRTGAFLGSPLYMSPEQVKDAKLSDARSDVWSLAATLYELLSGATPHGDAQTLGDLVMRICTRNAPSIQAHAPWVSPQLALVVHRGLHRDGGARYQSMRQFAAALRDSCPVTWQLCGRDLVGIDEQSRSSRAPPADVRSVMAPEDAAANTIPPDPLIGKVIGGAYTVKRLCGRGAMGAVYEAEDQRTERVAIKLIAPEANQRGNDGKRRLLVEAETSRSIDSRHVVKTLAVGVDETSGQPFIVMELLKGSDLAEILRRYGGLLSPRAVVKIALQAAHGLAAAHLRGVVHRDIKPANIFLCRYRGDPNVRVKVCDFGIAKQLLGQGADAPELTRTGGLLGSPMYMSPEQARNAKSVDHRSDIWSLGVSCYEALCGRRPFETAGDLAAVLVAICTDAVPPLQDHAPWVEPGLAEVVHRMLERDLERRWQSAEALIEALRPFADGAELAPGDVIGVDYQLKSVRAARAASVDLASLPPPTTLPAAAPRAKRASLIGVGAAALTVASIGGMAAYQRFSREEPAVVTPERKASGAAQVLFLGVAPPDATAIVDGRPASVDNGSLALKGEPGRTFDVSLRKDDRTTRVAVTIGLDGRLNPPALELAAPVAALSAAIASAKPEPGTDASRVAPRSRMPPRTPAPPAATAVAAPSPAEPASNAGPKADNW